MCVYMCRHIGIHACRHTCMHACMHTCMHTYIHAYIHIHTRMHTYVRTYECTYERTYVRTYVHMYIRTYVHTHIGTYTCLYIYIYICIYACVCMYVYIYIYIHIYIYIYKNIYVCLHGWRAGLDEMGGRTDAMKNGCVFMYVIMHACMCSCMNVLDVWNDTECDVSIVGNVCMHIGRSVCLSACLTLGRSACLPGCVCRFVCLFLCMYAVDHSLFRILHYIVDKIHDIAWRPAGWTVSGYPNRGRVLEEFQLTVLRMGFCYLELRYLCIFGPSPLDPKTEILNPETLKPKMSGGVAAFQGLCGHDRRSETRGALWIGFGGVYSGLGLTLEALL